jgi:hypothetical protein
MKKIAILPLSSILKKMGVIRRRNKEEIGP